MCFKLKCSYNPNWHSFEKGGAINNYAMKTNMYLNCLSKLECKVTLQ